MSILIMVHFILFTTKVCAVRFTTCLLIVSCRILKHSLFCVLKVREDQEKKRLDEELQSQLLPAQQPGQQSSTEMPQSQPVPQPASYVPTQPNQHTTHMPAQPASQQSLQSSNYNTPQPAQLTGMAQVIPYVPQSTGQVPVAVQGQSVASIHPESEDPEADQHQQLQHPAGVCQR